VSTKLLVIRHGNTFDAGQTPVRVGLGTDMPLSSSGREQAITLGRYLKISGLRPVAAFSSELIRTQETAELAFREADISCRIERMEIFNEIDYGPDEGKTEEEVIERIGAEALELWNKSGIVPDGWLFDVGAAVKNWKDFAAVSESKYRDGVIMVFSSNGIARFAPHLTGDFEKFSEKFKIKMSTGALSIFEKNPGEEYWSVVAWNLRPKDYVHL
jgi:probable phosphoglycerate mutase